MSDHYRDTVRAWYRTAYALSAEPVDDRHASRATTIYGLVAMIADARAYASDCKAAGDDIGRAIGLGQARGLAACLAAAEGLTATVARAYILGLSARGSRRYAHTDNERDSWRYEAKHSATRAFRAYALGRARAAG